MAELLFMVLMLPVNDSWLFAVGKVFGLCYREEKNSAGLDHILAAVNIFCSVFAVNCRIQVCKLGEEILPKLLYVWTQHRPKDSLKELIIELLNLQVRIHHPKGAKIQEKGK